MDKNIFFELVTKVLSGEVTQSEKKLFDSYMIDEEYRNIYDWLKKEWYKEIKHSTEKFEYAKGLEKLRTKIKNVEQARQSASIRKIPYRKRVLRIAASVILLLTAGFLAKSLLFDENPEKQVRLISYETLRGEKKIVELPDGSKVHLNSQTNISYPSDFSVGGRRVNLSGEAFFQVKRDTERPFIVFSGDVATTVLGTSFNISAFSENDTYVTVESGKVKVTNQLDDAELILLKGEQVIYDRNTGNITKMSVDTGPHTSWRNGVLYFDGVTFGKAIDEMERWYNVTIKCSSPTLLDRNIRGIYKNETLSEVLEDMQFMLELQHEFVNDSLIVIKQ